MVVSKAFSLPVTSVSEVIMKSQFILFISLLPNNCPLQVQDGEKHKYAFLITCILMIISLGKMNV